MPRLIMTATALAGLERCRRFLVEKDRQVARRAAQIISNQLVRLEADPNIGRPFDQLPELRELVIAFGDAGYVALYRFNPSESAVYVLAFRHQREAGY
ncbi:plasmid stabilization protein [Pseudomonas fluorescens]|uniref:Type II toxin-antitoxin system RelE/ParE family toxin n=1 Tax=Pseudomonas lactucae TaxID=2813360 RepID=A0A9X0YGJ8_9PSED|nr:type II toxin-antitoxin system RelE/ParE family toxin [Pseudomonas lactucae]MBN2986100.1 type II toxin-antitoxin system RelE/ParE family toxin [Pseudomonas lactucae]OPA92202.1 plasmid stabilization protein [Pseudomonas fluorescens]OPB10852.1 plasmid stabilization protein [Pseudomonas fluorescens]OPB22499.1 plasmid stabilization protein [Pseudomonas fluorescens]